MKKNAFKNYKFFFIIKKPIIIIQCKVDHLMQLILNHLYSFHMQHQLYHHYIAMIFYMYFHQPNVIFLNLQNMILKHLNLHLSIIVEQQHLYNYMQDHKILLHLHQLTKNVFIISCTKKKQKKLKFFFSVSIFSNFLWCMTI